jgi:uncharacterized NAD(P)/FAD-binding protein YdhS
MFASFVQSIQGRPRSIAIVGAGASGALVAAHLLARGGDDIRLSLIEPREQIGRGLAYATENESHRLNVRASNMSAFADDPDHFWRRLERSGYAGDGAFCFAPRSVFGHYLASLVDEHLAATPASRARWLRETVVGLTQRQGSVLVRFSSGGSAEFDVAILCCGHEPAEALVAPFVSPWEEPSAWNTAPDSTILIVGTGLTMIDAALHRARAAAPRPADQTRLAARREGFFVSLVVGPMSQAAFWESIAVPDIRLQAAALARRLRRASRRDQHARLAPLKGRRHRLGGHSRLRTASHRAFPIPRLSSLSQT